MRFLVDADMPRRVARDLLALGHDAVDVRDIGLGSARDHDIAVHARANGRCLVTGDFDFADIRNYPPNEYVGILVVSPLPNATAAVIAHMVRTFVADHELLGRLPGRLAIVEPGRVRLRPPLQ
jgi:predicted nuclease of predicted toxin-antitoxin system